MCPDPEAPASPSQVPMTSCGSDMAPLRQALLSGLFTNAAVLLPDSKSLTAF